MDRNGFAAGSSLERGRGTTVHAASMATSTIATIRGMDIEGGIPVAARDGATMIAIGVAGAIGIGIAAEKQVK